MTDIDRVNIRRLDFTLLLVLAETLRLRKLTLVAKRLGLTQPAISHALARLRDVFGDPLFLRRRHGLEPTARALALEPQVLAILGLALRTLSAPAAFDPATARRRIRIATLDHHAAVFGAPLSGLFERQAPGLELVLRAASRQEALGLLDTGDADLFVGFINDAGGSYLRDRLFDETYAVVARKANRRFDGSLRSYTAARHLLVSVAGESHGIVDEALEKRGLARKVAAVFPLFLPALATVAETDLIATVPRRFA